MKYPQFIFVRSFSRFFVLVVAVACLAAAALAQNPVPQIVGPPKPMAVMPGSGAFTLTVYGANFVPGAIVNWNYQTRATTFLSAHELQAQILATDILTNTAGMITVTNPAPGGGSSSASWAQIEVHTPITTFSLGKQRTYGFGGWLVMSADYTNSGILGLIGQSGDDLVLYDGSGKGVFQFQSIAGHFYDGAHGGVFGDFNGDGNLDLAYAAGYEGLPSSQTNIVLGNGRGQFSVGSQIKGNVFFQWVVTGDFNRDGKLDLIISDSAIHVYLGNGNGTFTHFKDYKYGAYNMVVGDFNSDGELDIAALGPSSSGDVLNIFFGNGDGTFQAPKMITALPGGAPCGIQNYLQTTDFNSDGNLDLVFCTDSQIGLVLGNGDGTFQQPTFLNAGTQRQFTFAVGDMNADGKPDLLISQYNVSTDPQFAIFLGNGDGTFQLSQVMNLPQAELGITVGDFNSDGLPDFIIEDGGVLVYLQ